MCPFLVCGTQAVPTDTISADDPGAFDGITRTYTAVADGRPPRRTRRRGHHLSRTGTQAPSIFVDAGGEAAWSHADLSSSVAARPDRAVCRTANHGFRMALMPAGAARCRTAAGGCDHPSEWHKTSLHRRFRVSVALDDPISGRAVPGPVERWIARCLPGPRAGLSETAGGGVSSLLHVNCLRCSCSNARSRPPVAGRPFIRASMEFRLPARSGSPGQLPSCSTPSGMALDTCRFEGPT